MAVTAPVAAIHFSSGNLTTSATRAACIYIGGCGKANKFNELSKKIFPCLNYEKA